MNAFDRTILEQIKAGTFPLGLQHQIRALADCLLSATTPPSSVPTSETPAPKLSEWHGANQAAIRELTVTAITDFFRSTGYIVPVCLGATWEGSSTLKLTLRWPTASTENKAGDPGLVSRTD